MNTNTSTGEGDMAAVIQSLVERIDRMEKAIQSGELIRTVIPSTEQAITLVRLERLTLKRHAVLTAALGGVGYASLASWMKCDETTIKLHLKGALKLLEIPTRTLLLARHPKLLDFIPDADYKARFGLSKTWWLEQEANLMAVLCRTKATANQHTSGVQGDLHAAKQQRTQDGGTTGGTT